MVSQVWPAMTSVYWLPLIGMEVGEARNQIIYAAKKTGLKYVLFWDDDVIPPAFCCHHLVTLMEMNPHVSVLGGVYPTKSFPPAPLVYKDWATSWDWKVGEFFPVTMTGMGMTLIRLADLDRLDVEEYPAIVGGEHAKVRRYFHTGKGINLKPGMLEHTGWTEDAYFATKVQEAGLNWYCDASVHTICQHYNAGMDALFSVPIDVGLPKPFDPMAEDFKVCELGAGKQWQNGTQLANPTPTVVRVDSNPDAHPDFLCDVRVLPSEWKDTFDEVRSKHCLEHIRWEERDDTIEEWVRILKPGGMIRIVVPDLLWAGEQIVAGRVLDPEIMGSIFGDQGSKYWHAGQDIGIHLCGYTPEDLKARLEAHGIEDVQGERYTEVGVMQITGRKAAAHAKTEEESDDAETAGPI